MAAKDIAEKTLEDFNDVFADIVNVLLFNGADKVKEDELENAATRSAYKADGKLREQERDTAKYWRHSKVRIAIFGLENQSTADNDMPLRTYGYDGASYRDQIYDVKDDNGNWTRNTNPRYPVITLVLYFGLKRWDKARTLYEALGSNLDEDLKPFVTDVPINLFEIAFLSDDQVKMFQSDFGIVADYFVQMRKDKSYKPSNTQMKHIREVLQLMSVLTNDKRFEVAANAGVRKGDEPDTMTEWLDRAIEEATEKTKKEAEINTIESAKRMQSDGLTHEKIAQYLNETVDTIKKWLEPKPAATTQQTA